MGWGALLFSFNGRVGRAVWWVALSLLVAAAIVLILIAVAIAILLDAIGGPEGAAIDVLRFLPLIAFYSGLAIAAKRLHDRGKSAWWLVIFYLLPGIPGYFAPIMPGDVAAGGQALASVLALAGGALTIWGIVELGFLPGTAGDNQYGPDPQADPRPISPADAAAVLGALTMVSAMLSAFVPAPEFLQIAILRFGEFVLPVSILPGVFLGGVVSAGVYLWVTKSPLPIAVVWIMTAFAATLALDFRLQVTTPDFLYSLLGPALTFLVPDFCAGLIFAA